MLRHDSGQGASKGFGFVEYSTHEEQLAALDAQQLAAEREGKRAMAAPTTAMESVEYRQGASAAADRRVSVIRRVFGEATYDVGQTDKSISTAFLADGGYDGRVQTNPSVSEERKGMSTTGASSSGSGLFVSTSFSGGSGDQQTRPAPGGGEGTLEVIDSRTGKQYEVDR